MPKYDYICDQCESEVEITKVMLDDSKKYCELCGRELRRLYDRSSGKFILKGSGFHTNDYSS